MLVFWLHNFPQKLTVSSAFTVRCFHINVQLLEIKGGGGGWQEVMLTERSAGATPCPKSWTSTQSFSPHICPGQWFSFGSPFYKRVWGTKSLSNLPGATSLLVEQAVNLSTP